MTVQWGTIAIGHWLQALVWLCMASTLLAALPVLVQEVRRPTARGLLTCMASSAFAFYLFSYQVMPCCSQLTIFHERMQQLECKVEGEGHHFIPLIFKKPPCLCSGDFHMMPLWEVVASVGAGA